MANKPIHGYSEWADEVCKALGEDPSKVRSIDIHIDPNKIVTATIEKYVWKPDGNGGFLEVIKKVAWKEDSDFCCDNCYLEEHGTLRPEAE